MAWFAFVLVGRVALAASTAIIVANVRRPKVQTTRQPRAMPTANASAAAPPPPSFAFEKLCFLFVVV